MLLRDDVRCFSNVVVASRPSDQEPFTPEEMLSMFREERKPDRALEFRSSHNVLVNMGRQWLRNLICASDFPSPVVGGEDLGTPYSIVPSPTALPGNKKTYRVRFMAVGVGGSLQNVLAPGTYNEDVGVTGLESPVTIGGVPPGPGGTADWMMQVYPTDDLSDTLLIPSDFAARFRIILGPGDVSYVGSQEDDGTLHNTSVPISEAGLFTSEARPDLPPTGGGATPAYGLVAYNIFNSITKTPSITIEFGWELRF